MQRRKSLFGRVARRGAQGARDVDPGWHRRQRRKRADARVLVRLGAAASLLRRHHSSMGSDGGSKGRKDSRGDRQRPHWACEACNQQGNYATRDVCRGCGEAKGVPKRKGGGSPKAAAAAPVTPKAAPLSPQPKWAQRPNSAKDATIAELRAEIAKMHEDGKEKLLESTTDEEMDLDAEPSKPKIVQEDVDKLWRYHSATEDLFGEDSEQAVSAKAEAERAQKEMHAAKPISVRTKAAQRKVERFRKLVTRCQAAQVTASATSIAAYDDLIAKEKAVKQYSEYLATAQIELQAVVAEGTAAWSEGEAAPIHKMVSELPPEIASRPDIQLAAKKSREAWEALAKMCKETAGVEPGPAHAAQARAEQVDRDELQAEAEKAIQDAFIEFQANAARLSAEAGAAAATAAAAGGGAAAGAEVQPDDIQAKIDAAVLAVSGDLKRVCLATVLALTKRQRYL